MSINSVESSTTNRTGRAAAVLGIWVILLGAFAAIAPAAQAVLAIPFELISLVMFAPALACLIVIIRPRWMPAAWRSAVPRDVVIASALAVVAVAIFVGVLALLTGQAPSWPPHTAGAPLVVFLLIQLLGVLGEEIGWRGVVQRCGEQFAKPAVVSAIAGFVFGATHLGYWSLGILPVLTFAVTAMLMSLTITTLFIGSFWQRMIPAAIVHLGLNLGVTSLSVAEQPLVTTPLATAAAAVMLLAALLSRALVRRRASEVRTRS